MFFISPPHKKEKKKFRSPIEYLWFKSVLLLTAYIRNGTETFVLNLNIPQVPLLIYANR